MMFTLFEGWFWCFFLEKKDILEDFGPRKGGMVDGGGDYGGGGGGIVGSAGYCRTESGLNAGRKLVKEL